MNGKRKTENGERKMENGRRRTENGEWKTENTHDYWLFNHRRFDTIFQRKISGGPMSKSKALKNHSTTGVPFTQPSHLSRNWLFNQHFDRLSAPQSTITNQQSPIINHQP
jgi:hypothetical protein